MWAYGPNWAGGQAFRRYERSRSDTVRARGRCLPLIRPFSAGAGALLSRASSMPSWVRGRPERSTTGICLSPCLSLSLSLSLSLPSLPLSLSPFSRTVARLGYRLDESRDQGMRIGATRQRSPLLVGTSALRSPLLLSLFFAWYPRFT